MDAKYSKVELQGGSEGKDVTERVYSLMDRVLSEFVTAFRSVIEGKGVGTLLRDAHPLLQNLDMEQIVNNFTETMVTGGMLQGYFELARFENTGFISDFDMKCLTEVHSKAKRVHKISNKWRFVIRIRQDGIVIITNENRDKWCCIM